MSDEVLVDDPGPDRPRIDATLTRSVVALKEFLARPGYAFSTAEVLANLRAVHGFLATVNAAYLGLVGELDARPEAPPGGPARGAARQDRGHLLAGGVADRWPAGRPGRARRHSDHVGGR